MFSSIVNQLHTCKSLQTIKIALFSTTKNLHYLNYSTRPISLAIPILAPLPYASSSSTAFFSTASKRALAVNIRMNKEIVEFKKSRSYPQLLAFIEINQKSFNHVNWSSCWSALGTASSFNDAEAVKESPVFEAFLRETVTKMEMGEAFFGAQSCANILHALAKLNLTGSDVDSLFFEIERNSKWFVENGAPQAISNAVWACATLNRPSPALFAEVEHNCAWLVENGKPQEVANIVWAFAILNYPSPLLFAEVESNSDFFVENGNPQNISNIVWAFAALSYSSPLLFAEVERNCEWLMKNGTPQAISNTVWACAKLNYSLPLLFAEVERNCEWLVENGNAHDVSNTFWAFATLNYASPLLFAEVERHGEQLLETGRSQDILNSLWSFAVLGGSLLRGKAFNELWNEAMGIKELRSEGWFQLYQVQLCAQIEAPDLNLKPLPDALRIQVAEALNSRNKQNTISQSHLEISDALSALEIAHVNEHSPLSEIDDGFSSDTFLAIDIAITDEKVAIEFYGPSHFVQNPNPNASSSEVQKNGATVMKERLLRKLGWSVISVSYYDWDRMKSMEEKTYVIAAHVKVAIEKRQEE